MSKMPLPRTRAVPAAAAVVFLAAILPAALASAEDGSAPEFRSQPPASARVGYEYLYAASAFDADGDALSFSLETFPAGMVVDHRGGIVRWTPVPGQVGNHSVALKVSDGKTAVSQSFTVAVSVPSSPAPPRLRLAYPKEGQSVNRTLFIAGIYESPPGSPPVAQVQVRLDGGEWLPAELDNGSFRFLLDTTRSPNKVHRLTVRAWDTVSHSEEQFLNITYDNPRYVLLDYPLEWEPGPGLHLGVLAAVLTGFSLLFIQVERRRARSRARP